MSGFLRSSSALLVLLWAVSCSQDGSPTADDMAAPSVDMAVADIAVSDGAQPDDLSTVDLVQLADPNDGPGVFAGAGNNIRHIRSIDDGMTWIDDVTEILPADMTSDTDGVRNVVAANHQFIAFAAKIFTSSDGKTWTEASPASQWIASMLYADGQYVSSGGYGWLATTVSDFTNWTQHPPYDNYVAAHHSTAALAHGVVGAQSSYVVVNDDGNVFRSVDAKNWQTTMAPVVPAGVTWGTQFSFGAGVFVGLLPSGKDFILSADGGATWTTPPSLATAVASMVYAQNHFTAVGAGHVYTSTDGATWTDHAQATAVAGSLSYGHGVYLALDGNGDIYRSTDGLTWTQVFQNAGNPNPLHAIAFNPN